MNFFHTHVGRGATRAVLNVLVSTMMSEGSAVKQFEDELTTQLGLVNPVAVNSGTSALHLALECIPMEWDAEVILPAQTFIATAFAVLYRGAKIVFADIDPETGNISVNDVIRKLTERTRAVIGVDWAGYPCDMGWLASELYMLGLSEKVRLIQDCAQSLGAVHHGQPTGQVYPDIACFSFQATKHVSTGDGGALTTPHIDIAETAYCLRWFGIDRDHDLPNELGERQYHLNRVGFKYHMNNVAAAIGLGNLDGFRDRLMKRVQNAATYDAHFRTVSGVTLMNYQNDRLSSYWIYPMRVERRTDFVRAMTSRGVPVSVVHQRIDRHPIFGGLQDLPGQALFDATQINLPVHDGLTYEDVTQVIDAVKGGW